MNMPYDMFSEVGIDPILHEIAARPGLQVTLIVGGSVFEGTVADPIQVITGALERVQKGLSGGPLGSSLKAFHQRKNLSCFIHLSDVKQLNGQTRTSVHDHLRVRMDHVTGFAVIEPPSA